MEDAQNSVLQGRGRVRCDEPAVFALFDLHFGATAAGGKYPFPLHECFGDVESEDFLANGGVYHDVKVPCELRDTRRRDLTVPDDARVVVVLRLQSCLIVPLVLISCAADEVQLDAWIVDAVEGLEENVETFDVGDAADVVEADCSVEYGRKGGGKGGAGYAVGKDVYFVGRAAVAHHAFLDQSRRGDEKCSFLVNITPFLLLGCDVSSDTADGGDEVDEGELVEDGADPAVETCREEAEQGVKE